MLFVDEFCGILVYIKFGADVTSQYKYTTGGYFFLYRFLLVFKKILWLCRGYIWLFSW